MRKKFSKKVLILLLTFANLVVGYSLCRQLMVIRQESDVKIDVYAFDKNVKKSQKKIYPDLSELDHLSILVSISQQKMIVYSGNKVIFKTKVSTGAKETPTPTGKFAIEAERGEFLYDDSLNRGACDWVSFKDHGGYRFESLPTDWKGKILKGESKKIGTACTDGNVRLSKEDAKWLFENMPEGVIVSIH
ncbi:L,D-transpeptidase [Streptococcus equinus]|uniref:L,D-transpeptidase n=1 Tax=Streptococcus equinus TaxID=1335 RepID=UPI00088FA5F1|nr:L,D-transpeptidase [Streptococcus equinus]UOC11680.1 L,D-transpeptidase [Streptococcus equinus]SDQ06158.1 L,D-transpeptidase catalytic domain [Streptococcus equinus]SEN48919.1 L,D-transpeptidase catalytic domain [Streptococcus equinus]